MIVSDAWEGCTTVHYQVLVKTPHGSHWIRSGRPAKTVRYETREDAARAADAYVKRWFGGVPAGTGTVWRITTTEEELA